MNVGKKPVALVTGASSGIGRSTAHALAKAGYQVFGTSRKVVSDTAAVTMLVADVTQEASVQAMLAEVMQRAGRIDLVINNAGIGLMGAAEESSIAQAQALFDVNLFGVARVINAVLPAMRAQKAGRIVNVSSVLGRIPAPFNAFYAATKHALEGYSESLDHELRSQGIRVTLVEPGVTRTAFEENLGRADKPMALYDVQRQRSEALMRQWVAVGDDPQVVADAVVEAATAQTPKLRYPAGKQSRLVGLLRRLVPERFFDRSIRKFNGFEA